MNRVYFLIIMLFFFLGCKEESFEPSPEPKKVVCWGNSLTYGAGGNGISYPQTLQDILGSTYEVINCGVSGENSLTIAARQGGIPMYIGSNVIFDEDKREVVIGVRTDTNLKSLYDDSDVRPLLLGGRETVNSCFIDDQEVNIKWKGKDWKDPDGQYSLELVAETNQRIELSSGSIVLTAAMRNLRGAFANIFFIGQNGGWKTNDSLIEQIKMMIEFSGSDNFMVVGIHARGTLQEMKSLELQMTKEFGPRYFNLRSYMATKALNDAGLLPSSVDSLAMQQGLCPPQLLSDDIHFNEIGYSLMGQMIAKRFNQLGL